MEEEIKQIREQLNKLEEKLNKLENPNNWTKIGDLEWSENLGKMDWDKACEKCEELGGRLPTRLELIDLYDNHQEEIENWDVFFWSYFWSSTEYESDDAYTVKLSEGFVLVEGKNCNNSVRCVRECN